jgi:DNA end-binding protein Ku
LHCIGNTIVMTTLRYADEIRDAGELKIPGKNAKTAISDKELKMAMALVEGMSEDWEPEQYHDTYREDVLALIEKKVKARQTKTITMPDLDEKPAKATNVIDLVSLLQASLGKKPGKAAAAEDDDDEPPPPKRARKPAEEDEEEEPAPRRRTAAASREAVAAKAAPKRAPARKAAAKPAAKAAAARETADKAPVRRKKAA